ncbi:hypothetical protein LXL04_002047 [Taraxacum kok-saghyz]
MQYVIISRKGKPTSIGSSKLRRSGSSGVPGGMPFGLRHYTNVYVGHDSVDNSLGYPRDAPATVLFGEWFRFVKPSDQQFFFEKTKHTSNFLAFEASLMSIRDNKVLEVEFKFDSICCSLSITTASSGPKTAKKKYPECPNNPKQ